MKNLNWKTTAQTYVAVICCALFILPVQAGQVTYPDNSYTSGDTLTATDLNAKFNEVKADVNNNNDRIAALELLVAALQTALADKADASHTHAQSDVTNLESDISDLQAGVVPQLGAYLSLGNDVNGKMTALFSGINVQVVNGTSIQASTNGVGNLIVGYNEPHDTTDDKTGSHNLVAGNQNSYPSAGTVVFGFNNMASAVNSSVTGGINNTASVSSSSVSGGIENTANGLYSSVSGGRGNQASGMYSSVSGGQANTASNSYSSASGGFYNAASGFYSSVNGGAYNEASGERSSTSGGQNNVASGLYSSVSGGSYGQASGNRSSVSGGISNMASGYISSVSGGYDNEASAFWSSVSGGGGSGNGNVASHEGSSILGGSSKVTTTNYDSVP